MTSATIMGMLGSMFGRLMVGVIATISAASLILLGALGRSSEAQALIMFAWLVAFVSIAWTLLPAVRFGTMPALIAMLIWFAAGVYAANFGAPGVKGYPLSSWVVASMVLIGLIFRQPPAYLEVWTKRIPNRRHFVISTVFGAVCVLLYTVVHAVAHGSLIAAMFIYWLLMPSLKLGSPLGISGTAFEYALVFLAQSVVAYLLCLVWGLIKRDVDRTKEQNTNA